MKIFEKLNSNLFILIIFTFFSIGTFLLILIEYNSFRNIELLMGGNKNLAIELSKSNHLREVERDLIWIESRIRAAIATDDTTHLEGIDSKTAEINIDLNLMKTGNSGAGEMAGINRLAEIAAKKQQTKNRLISEFNISRKMDNLSHISNPDARKTSNEISQLVGSITKERQILIGSLNDKIQQQLDRARTLGIGMTVFLIFCAFICCWFIINKMRFQNKLILQLDESERKSRESARAKENFMANMSHEIRTPLNSILGFTNLLAIELLPPKPAEFVNNIQKAGENLLSIINDILDLSKIQAGMVRIEQRPFSVRGLLDSIRTLFQIKLNEKQLYLKINIHDSIPDTLLGDATRLTQILVNLIGNGIKFTEKGGLKINLSISELKMAHVSLEFEITDTGIGIEEGKIAYIFDRFRQAEDSTTRTYGGTGLGLAIVKDLVELQSGKIDVVSVEGSGTSFFVTIPYLIASEQLNTYIKVEQPDIQDYAEGNLRLLVIDDNRMNQDLMRHLLEHWKLKFDIAGDARSGISLLEDGDYEMILMDIQMPGMDGYEATRYIRKQLHSKIPIVAMTAHAMAGEREKCLSLGMDEYLSKPINEEQLLKMIKRFSPIKPENLATFNAVESFVEASTPLYHAYSVIDLGYMKEISKGNMDYEKKVTAQFLEVIPNSLKLMNRCVTSRTWDELASLAHEMRSSLYIMGMGSKTEGYITVLETSFVEKDIKKSLVQLENLCRIAMIEAADFYMSLS